MQPRHDEILFESRRTDWFQELMVMKSFHASEAIARESCPDVYFEN